MIKKQNINSVLLLFVFFLSCAKLDKNGEWDNPLDPNGQNYYPPTVYGMNDTIVVINDSFNLHASAIDSNGLIDRYIWSFDSGDSWQDSVEESKGLSHVFSPEKAGRNLVLVKAIDDDGLVSKSDTVFIDVDLAPPSLEQINDKLISSDSTIKIFISAEDKNDGGFIEKYLIDIGADGWDDSSESNNFTLKNLDGGKVEYIIAARDDDMNIVEDTFSIRYNREPSQLSIKNFNSGDTIYYKDVNLLDLNGSVNFIFQASDPDSLYDTLYYTFYTWISGDSPEMVYHGTNKNVIVNNLEMAKKYQYNLIVKDVFGDSISIQGTFYTEVIDIVNPIITLLGDNPLNIPKGFTYKELGFNGFDGIDGEITDSVKVISNNINSSIVGNYEIVYSLSDNAGNDTIVKRVVNVNEYISLENFESGKSWQSTFGSLFEDNDSTGYWKAWSDIYSGGNTAIRPEINLGTDSAFKNNHISNIGIDQGNAFNVNIAIGEDAYYPYWGVGFFLKNKGEYYDLSGMDSLVLYVKGSIATDTGSYRIQFTYKAIDTLWEDGRWGYAGKELALTNEWQKITILPSEIKGVDASSGDGHTWDMIKNEINMIQFCEQPGEADIPDVELFIDDIRLYGDFSNTKLISH